MENEFYHRNIFGDIVDVNLNEQEEINQITGISNKEFNIFALTDAFGARKKKEVWILYQKALSVGISPEEVFFKLFWLVKSMLIVSKTKSINETDMKAFPYNKAKGFLKNFSLNELEEISESLVVGYYETRSGAGDINIFIERLLLKI